MSQRHEQQWYLWIRGAALVAILTLLTTGPIYTFSHIFIGPTTGWEDPKVKYPFIAVGVAAAIVWFVAAARKELASPGVGIFIGGALTILLVISNWWSVSPEVTTWRTITYVGLFLFAWVLCSLEPTELVAVISATVGLGLALSVAVRIFWPGFFSNAEGLWQGVFTNPNSLGPVAAIAILCGLYWLAADTERIVQVVAGIAVLGAAIAVYKTKSDTSFLGLGISVLATGLLAAGTYLWKRGQRLLVAAGGVVAGAMGVVVISTQWSSLWSQGGLAQRREVWDEVLFRISIKPWSGYGFFMYWENPAGQSPRFLARAGSAHNSTLDVALSVGWFGAALFVLLCAVALYVGIRTAITHPGPLSWLWCAVAIFLVVEHSFESFILWFSYLWVLLIVAAHGPALLRNSSSPGDDE